MDQYRFVNGPTNILNYQIRCVRERQCEDAHEWPEATGRSDGCPQGRPTGPLPFIETVVERCRHRVCESVLVRVDASFPNGETLKGLEAPGIDSVARIGNNAVLDGMAQPYLRRPPGRPPRGGRAWFSRVVRA